MSTTNDTIFWITVKHTKKLATLNPTKKNQVDKEELVEMNGNEYRVWNPYRSKLAAAIINGIEVFPILKNTKILYFDSNMGITPSHISDIVGKDGKIFVVGNNNKSFNFLDKIASIRSNITVIHDAENLVPYNSIKDKVDVIYADVTYGNDFDLDMLNSKTHLMDTGYIMLVVKTKDILVNEDGTEPKNNLRNKIRNAFEIIQEIPLSNFFKEDSMIIAKYLDS